MEREAAPEVEIKVQPRVGGNTIHPLEPNPEAEVEAAAAATPPPRRPSRRPLAARQRQEALRPSRRWSPWLVTAFVAANVVMFVATMAVNDCPKNSSSCFARFLGRFAFQPLKENPLLGPSSLTLEKMGALDATKVVQGHQGWRLITCIWLHAGVVHILVNMISLLVIGIQLEQEFGFVRIGLLYVISGFGGSLLSALFIKSSISVGASGALFGLLGGMLSELLTNWTIYANRFAALSILIFIIAINLAFGILPHVDNFAHIGGFLSGFLLGFVFFIRPQFGWVSRKHAPPGYPAASVKPKHNMCQYILWVMAAIILIVGFTVGLVMLFRGVNGNDHCSWCHYMSCVPTSRWSCKSSAMYCSSSQYASSLNLTCTGNGISQSYPLTNATETQIEELCTQLCS